MRKSLFLMLILVTSCGGGGGGSSQPPTIPTTNASPVINNAVSEIEIEEGMMNVLTIQASDPDGDSLR